MRKHNDLYVRITLFVIITLGFLLRINHWFDFLGADEIGKTGLMTWSWDFHKDPFPIHYYPPFFMYLNFVFSFILNKLVIFLGIIDFNNIFQNTDFGFIFTLKTGRILSAIFGTFNIYMVYLLGKEFFNKYAGISAALLLSVFWPHVIDSHNFKSDVLLTLLITIVVYYALKFLRTKNKLNLFLASFFFGLSVAAKFNGVFFGIVLLIPLFYLRKEFSFVKGFFYVAVGSAAGFFSGAPNWLVHPVSNIKVTLKYLSRLSEELVWYDPFPSSFILYGKNLLEHFGILLIIIFIAGMILSFIRKNREAVLISFSLLVYFIMAGRENYLNYRAILPLIPLVAIIIGKVIFVDTKELFRGSRIRWSVTALLLIPVSIYSFVNFTRSYKSFDLLKGIASHPVRERAGIGEPDYSAYYMRNHFGRSSFTFREMWTPPAVGFRGSVFGRDVTKVPEKMFTGKRKFDFLITSFRTDYILRKTKSMKFKNAAKNRLKNYSPFYEVERPAIFTWSDDILFWYRKPNYIKGNLRLDKGMPLPRTFVPLNENPSIHLPLQRYEKDPCYGVVKNGIAGKYIFSKKEIEKIVFSFISREKLKLKVDVNGEKAVHISEKGAYTCSIEISDMVPQEFSKTAIRKLFEASLDPDELKKEYFIYKIEIRSNTHDNIPYTFSVEYTGEGISKTEYKRPVDEIHDTQGEIPELFSDSVTPRWVKTFFKRNGVDLILLSYINSLTIYENKNSSIDKIDTGYMPINCGQYNVAVVSEQIVRNSPAYKKGELKIILISGESREEINLDPGDGDSGKDIYFKHESGFFRIISSGIRDSNLMIKKITIVPDFKKSIRKLQ